MKFGLLAKAKDDSVYYKEMIYALLDWGIHCDRIVEYNYVNQDNGDEFIGAIAYCQAPVWRMAWFLVRNRFKFMMLDDGLLIWTIPVK